MAGRPIDRRDHFAPITREMMESESWQSMSTAAQALYPWLRLEWHGPKANNNGDIYLSVRQAAERLNVSRKTAAKAFHELQAHGFIVVTKPAELGLHGRARGPAFELTTIQMPTSEKNGGRALYRSWKPGSDFPVHRTLARNPKGKNGRVNVTPLKVVT